MSTSVQVMVLVTVAAIAILYAFYLDVRRQAEENRLLAWLKAERREQWDALSRSDRLLSFRAVEILRRGALAGDAEFQSRYEASRYGPRFTIALAVGVAAVALVIVGTLFLDWNW